MRQDLGAFGQGDPVVPWPANFSTLVISSTRSFSIMAIPLGCETMVDPTDPSASAAPEQASFGYRDVPAAEKAGMVRQVFESVAPRYDLMNDLMSGGVHRLWKNTLVDVLNPRPGERFLDVAGGTGDVAFRIVRRQGERPDVSVCDINAAMLAVGRDRAVDRGLLKGLTWTTGDAENLPFPDRSFDGYTIAFGLRNVTDIDKALGEAHRVLKPGGRFYCLEFSKVTSARWAASTTPIPAVRCRSSAASSPRTPSPTAYICTRASAASRRSANWRDACARSVSPTSPGAT